MMSEGFVVIRIGDVVRVRTRVGVSERRIVTGRCVEGLFTKAQAADDPTFEELFGAQRLSPYESIIKVQP